MTPTQQLYRKGILTTAYKDFEKGLNVYAYYKLHDRGTSEDMVQVTFMKTWGYLVKGGKIETMRAFLYHVLNNLIVDEYRKRKTTSLDVLLEKGFEPAVDESKQLFNIIDGKKAIMLIPHLPKKYHKIMKMRYVQLLSLKEMAELTGQSKNTIAVQAHRGLEKLKLMCNVL
jgi:RNA polymerase sigma-70 factor (ECF subfamily)